MFKLAKTAVLSALIGLGGLAAVPATAQAEGIYLNFGRHSDTGFGVRVGERVDSRRDSRRGCSPRRALNKANRMGVRHARIVRANRRVVKVAGRKHHRRAIVVFANRRGCPVAFR